MKKSIITSINLSLLLAVFLDSFWELNLFSIEIFIALLVILVFSGLFANLSINDTYLKKLKVSSSDIYHFKITKIDWVNLIIGFSAILQVFLQEERNKYIMIALAIMSFTNTIINFIFQKIKRNHVLGLKDSEIIILQNHKRTIDLKKVSSYSVIGQKIKLQTKWGSNTINATKFDHSEGLINQITTRIDALKNKSNFVTPIPPK